MQEAKNKYEYAKRLYKEGKYQEVIDYVDGLFGWKPGELERKEGSEQENAKWCLGIIEGWK